MAFAGQVDAIIVFGLSQGLLKYWPHFRYFPKTAKEHIEVLKMLSPPDWNLPTGVDRGLWDYLHNPDVALAYDTQMSHSPLAEADVAFCEQAFPAPGRLIDLGCGTGRLALHFAKRGYNCTGIDLSEHMLACAQSKADSQGLKVEWLKANLANDLPLPSASFDYAACLFSTLGMIRGEANRRGVVANVARILTTKGRFVLHVHNRWFSGLGQGRLWSQRIRSWLGREDAGDITMPQPQGGAPLTLHHFTKRELLNLLISHGFQVMKFQPVAVDGRHCLPWKSPYGYLVLAGR